VDVPDTGAVGAPLGRSLGDAAELGEGSLEGSGALLGLPALFGGTSILRGSACGCSCRTNGRPASVKTPEPVRETPAPVRIKKAATVHLPGRNRLGRRRAVCSGGDVFSRRSAAGPWPLMVDAAGSHRCLVAMESDTLELIDDPHHVATRSAVATNPTNTGIIRTASHRHMDIPVRTSGDLSLEKSLESHPYPWIGVTRCA
jgi:hypothetical protein